MSPGAIFDVLSRDFHVVAFDARGHGKSDKPHEVGRYGTERVEDVARLLDHLGIRAAHLVGYARMDAMALGLAQGDARPVLLRENEPPPPPEEFERIARDLFSRNDPLALAAAARSFGEATLVTPEEINRLSMPLLAVVGGADMAKEGVDAFRVVRPDLQVVVVDGATHFGSRGVRRRPEFAAAVHDFLIARSASHQ